jgi:hypothetical protein
MNTTAETISNGSDVEVWRKAIPEEASRHEFLMDGLLAISSLNFASEHPEVRWRYIEFAGRYQESGLRKYTQALQQVTEDNSHSLFAYAIVTMILALAFTTMHEESTRPSSVDDMTSFFRLLQGVGAINLASRTCLKEGPFQAMWNLNPMEGEIVDLRPDAANALGQLQQRAEKLAALESPEKSRIYLTSIERLDHVFRHVETSQNLRHIMAWPAMVSKELLEYLRSGDPMAQLIFLHYGVLLLRAHDRWWGRGFGLRFIVELATSLSSIDTDWASATEWPKSCATSMKYACSKSVQALG